MDTLDTKTNVDDLREDLEKLVMIEEVAERRQEIIEKRLEGIYALTSKLEAAQRNGTLPQVVIPVDFAGLPTVLREIRALADRCLSRVPVRSSHSDV